MPKFVLYWLDGSRSVVEAPTVQAAFSKLGYGQGALSALDFYSDDENAEYYYDKTERCWKRDFSNYDNTLKASDKFVLAPVNELVKDEIEDLNNFPLTELQQKLVNYLLEKVDNIIDELNIV